MSTISLAHLRGLRYPACSEQLDLPPPTVSGPDHTTIVTFTCMRTPPLRISAPDKLRDWCTTMQEGGAGELVLVLHEDDDGREPTAIEALIHHVVLTIGVGSSAVVVAAPSGASRLAVWRNVLDKVITDHFPQRCLLLHALLYGLLALNRAYRCIRLLTQWLNRSRK